uniref:Uncharacterized protein n=1 Tax=Oryza barthii TaxID=65489 RepID=A0A0D3HSX9_9ORYZ
MRRPCAHLRFWQGMAQRPRMLFFASGAAGRRHALLLFDRGAGNGVHALLLQLTAEWEDSKSLTKLE